MTNDYPATRGARPGDPHLRLRLTALIAVIAGVVLVAAAAFLLSYAGIHQIALQAGVAPTLARLYPLMFDAMLVVTCAAVLALRNAGWGAKFYVWACLLLVLAAVAAGDALHAIGVQLTSQAARAAIAVIPWVLLLMGFGIWLVMLRQWRRARAAAALSAAESGQAGRERPAIAAPAAAAAGAVTSVEGRGAARTQPPGNSSGGIDTLLGRDAGRAVDRASAAEAEAAGAPAQEEQQQTAEPGQTRPAAGTATAAAAGAAVAGTGAAGTGAAGTGQNGSTTGATGTGQGRGRKDNGDDRGSRTRLGGLLKLPDSKPDEEEEEGSVRLLPAETKATAPAEGADAGQDGHVDGAGAQAGDTAAQTGDAAATAGSGAQAEDTAQAGDGAHARDTAAQTGDTAATTGSGAQAGDGAHDGDTAQAGDGAHDGDGADTGPVSAPPAVAAQAPHFDRLRSSPTPPGETGTGGE